MVCAFSEEHITIEKLHVMMHITDLRTTHNRENKNEYIIIVFFFLEIAHVYKYSMYSLEIKLFVV